MHPGQVGAYLAPGRFKAIRCGRRWGKTTLLETIAADACARGQRVGVFAPDYKVTDEIFNNIADILHPIELQSAQNKGIYRTSVNGVIGRIEFWTLENDRAGRSRKYHKVLMDEAAFAKQNARDIWERNIRPTLLDYSGTAIVFSTPNGSNPGNFFWACCNDPQLGFQEYHAPTSTNPLMPAHELEKLERENHPLVYRQEYLAEFVDWSGVAFFALDKLLLDGQPVAYPSVCDCVFATIDTAVKTNSHNDGTAVMYWAVNKNVPHVAKLTVLDWDIEQIEGALLEDWIPSVFRRLEQLAVECRARMGSIGALIEDKASGSVLLQQGAHRGWPTRPINSKLTGMGKDERAVSVSGYHFRGDVKFSGFAYDKVSSYKKSARNHAIGQIVGYRVGASDSRVAQDDLLDCYTYGLAIGLGTPRGL